MQRFRAPRGAARAWLVQRASGAVLALFVLVLLVQVVRAPAPFGYDAWAAIFSVHAMKMLTFAATLALAWATRRCAFVVPMPPASTSL